MPDRPLLILPTPIEPMERRKKSGGPGGFHRPSHERQVERLAPRFEQLQQTLEARHTRLQTDSQGIVPEEVVVLETVGTVDDFVRAVERMPGMEWLVEIEEEDIPPDDDFFALSKQGEEQLGKTLRGRLFMLFTNQGALQQMLSLWEAWQNGEKLPYGLGKWKTLFEQLRDVRTWGVQDRLFETYVLQDWQERVAHGQEMVPCEIELWHRQTPEQRHAARDRVAELVASRGGRVVTEANIEDIGYHALLVNLPISAVSDLVEQPHNDADLVQCEQIQFFRASGQMAAVMPDEERQRTDEEPDEELPDGEPVVALFDGLPLQAHRRLEGRLIVDDPDSFEADYPANERRHGTTMASLIVHGDLEADKAPLSRPLYVRPILQPDSRDWRRPREETVPQDTLAVDLIHRAVRRLFEGEGEEPPAAPNITVVNLSIGVRDRLFEGTQSPLARLLDWLAWRYQILFVVSAGNHPQRIELSAPRSEFAAFTPQELEHHTVCAIAGDTRNRRLLSPAEATNVITVGATHDDASNSTLPGRWSQPYANSGLPSPINAQGMGYRRAIKPDVLASGGRVVVQECLDSTEQATLEVYRGSLAPGHRSAAPGSTPGDRSAEWYSRGTSNSAALVSRASGLLYEVLEELRGDSGGELIDTVPRSVWLKALLGHSADWGSAGSRLSEILRTADNNRQFREYLTRLLGYGTVDVPRVQECTAYRATAISGGVISEDQALIHRFPLPPSLSGRRGYRRLIITLAWMTPVNPRHQGWRRADLWFTPPQDPIRTNRKQADSRAAQRGTLQHEILEGEQAAVFVEGANLEIQVSCRADAGKLEENIPYSLVATLEVAEDVGVQVYDEVQVAVNAARVRVSPAT